MEQKRLDVPGVRYLVVGLLLAVLTGTLFLVNIKLRATRLADPWSLEMLAPLSSNAPWNAANSYEAFRDSRFLFKTIQYLTWAGALRSDSPEVYYQLYLVLVSLTTFLAAFCYYSLLEKVFRVPPGYALTGALLFLFSFPVALGFDQTATVYMKGEDLLSYLLVVLGIWAILRRQPLLFAVLSVLGAITKENTLLLVPAFLLFSPEKVWTRLLWCLPGPAAAVGIRLVLRWAAASNGGNVAGGLFVGWAARDVNPFVGFTENMARPMETLGCLFVVFGVLWFLGSQAYFTRLRTLPTAEQAAPYRFLRRTTPLAVLLVLLVALTVSWVRENRTIFILFPWIITLAVIELWQSNFLAEITLRNRLTRTRLLAAGAVLFAFIVLLALVVIPPMRHALAGLLGWLKDVEHTLPQVWQDLFVPMSPLQVIYLFLQVGLAMVWAVWLISRGIRRRVSLRQLRPD
jgi:hypothetical protein